MSEAALRVLARPGRVAQWQGYFEIRSRSFSGTRWQYSSKWREFMWNGICGKVAHGNSPRASPSSQARRVLSGR
eukprot:4670945-Pleurochrysis_carterae.AAC.1